MIKGIRKIQRKKSFRKKAAFERTEEFVKYRQSGYANKNTRRA